MRTSNTTCPQCGKGFYRKPSYLKKVNAAFCSSRCYGDALKSGAFPREMPKRPKTGRDFHCVVCGKKFYRSAFWIKRGVTKTCGDPSCKSAYFSGANNGFWGKNHSDETKEKISKDRRARPTKKRGGRRKGYKHTPEARAAISKALRIRWIENRDKMLEAVRKGRRKQYTRTEPRYRSNFTPLQRREWKDGECKWCETTEDLTLDHIIPVMDGGRNTRANAQTLCISCNRWKMIFVDRPRYLAARAED